MKKIILLFSQLSILFAVSAQAQNQMETGCAAFNAYSAEVFLLGAANRAAPKSDGMLGKKFSSVFNLLEKQNGRYLYFTSLAFENGTVSGVIECKDHTNTMPGYIRVLSGSYAITNFHRGLLYQVQLQKETCSTCPRN